uniref:Endonuclease/exonuclease/phosphatase domain-containing protein n=1 Tax=Fagus sylvatica TaxID=28930 RepID=A0A2N9IVJ6_FAGSY
MDESLSTSSSRCFQNFIYNVSAIDLGFCDPRFTWTNKRVGWANIRERLDRGICNVDWQSLFPKAGVKHLTAPNSDHLPILLDTNMEVCSGPRPFQFEVMWVRDNSSKEVVQKAWDIPVEGSQSSKLVQKCQNVRKELISWNKLVFGFAKSRIQEIEELICKVQSLDPSQENLEMEASLNLELNE